MVSFYRSHRIIITPDHHKGFNFLIEKAGLVQSAGFDLHATDAAAVVDHCRELVNTICQGLRGDSGKGKSEHWKHTQGKASMEEHERYGYLSRDLNA